MFERFSGEDYMIIDHLTVGTFETNCYVLRASETAKACLIIDIGLESAGLIEFLKDKSLRAAGVVFTHGHVDHIGGVEVLRQEYPEVKVYIHKLDAEMLTGQKYNLSALAGVSFRTGPAEFCVDEGEKIEEAGIKLEVVHTPGHTAGGICLYCKNENIIFTGDTLFAGSVGRTDFPGGHPEQLIASIKKKLCILPDETVCYPGHGPVTSIAREKKQNPFLQ